MFENGDPSERLMEFGTDLEDAGKAVFEALVQPGMGFDDLSLCEEAGRLRDRLDSLQALITGKKSVWAEITTGHGDKLTLRIDDALKEARQLATVYRQLIGDLKRRWPDGYSDGDEDGLAGLEPMADPNWPPGAVPPHDD